MVGRLRGVNAAKQLLHNELQRGFTELWQQGRLDLTLDLKLEAHVAMPRYALLFTKRELEEARRKLTEHGMEIDKE